VISAFGPGSFNGWWEAAADRESELISTRPAVWHHPSNDLQERQVINPIMKYFGYAHLPPHLQEVSAPIGELANLMNMTLPDGPEKSAGLRKLLEAKDCFVRAKLG
jgi:hypothetical protein